METGGERFVHFDICQPLPLLENAGLLVGLTVLT